MARTKVDSRGGKQRPPTGAIGALRGTLVLLDWQEQIVRAALAELEGDAGSAKPAATNPVPKRPSNGPPATDTG